ncbi:MAG: LytTR family transcriptional regulator [Lachnospiraceae bacterium]|nr:LytTR family transcriptional regulator [Lachnospiraceae bacterium]
MKVKIEIDPEIRDTEITIRCSEITPEVAEIQKLLSEAGTHESQISFFKDDAEYFLSLSDILFFETGNGVIRAHTAEDDFEAKYKLYELEEKLPSYFLRISKSTILNTRKVYSITKNLAGASKIEFQETYKIVYCSRNYYKALKDSLMPRGEEI